MHIVLKDAEEYIHDTRYFGRDALTIALGLISEANADVNRRLVNRTIDYFDISRINKDLELLEKQANWKFHSTKLRLKERDAKGKARRSNANPAKKSLTITELRKKFNT